MFSRYEGRATHAMVSYWEHMRQLFFSYYAFLFGPASRYQVFLCICVHHASLVLYKLSMYPTFECFYVPLRFELLDL
jgi:hypothetical protein